MNGRDGSASWEPVPRTGVGRLAWVDPDRRISVVSVNYALDEHTAVIRTGDTTQPC